MQIPYNEELRPDTGLYNAKLGIWLFLASEIMLFGGLFSAYILLRSSGGMNMLIQEYLSIPLATLNTIVLITSSVTMVMSWVSLKLNNFKKYRMYMGLTLLCSFIFLVIKYFEYSAKFAHDPPLTPGYDNFLGIYFTLTGLHGLHIIGGILVNYYLWKQFDDSSKEKTHLIFNSIALFTLLLPWSVTGESDALISTRGFEATTGLLLFLVVIGSLLSSRVKYLKSLYSIFVGFGFLVALLSCCDFNSCGYWFFLIIYGMTFIDSLMMNPHADFENEPERFTNRVEVAGLYWHFVDLVWIFLFPALYLL